MVIELLREHLNTSSNILRKEIKIIEIIENNTKHTKQKIMPINIRGEELLYIYHCHKDNKNVSSIRYFPIDLKKSEPLSTSCPLNVYTSMIDIINNSNNLLGVSDTNISSSNFTENTSSNFTDDPNPTRKYKKGFITNLCESTTDSIEIKNESDNNKKYLWFFRN